MNEHVSSACLLIHTINHIQNFNNDNQVKRFERKLNSTFPNKFFFLHSLEKVHITLDYSIIVFDTMSKYCVWCRISNLEFGKSAKQTELVDRLVSLCLNRIKRLHSNQIKSLASWLLNVNEINFGIYFIRRVICLSTTRSKCSWLILHLFFRLYQFTHCVYDLSVFENDFDLKGKQVC